jgi:hypothetical protein
VSLNLHTSSSDCFPNKANTFCLNPWNNWKSWSKIPRPCLVKHSKGLASVCRCSGNHLILMLQSINRISP